MVRRGRPINISRFNGQHWTCGNMQRILSSILLCLVVLQSLSQCRPTQVDEQRKARNALRHYLEANSGEISKEEKGPLTQVLQFEKDPVVQAELMKALRSGPDDRVRDEAKRNFERQWDVLVVYREKHPPKALPPGKAAPAKMTKEAYVQMQLERLDRRYREKAAIALVKIAADTGSKEIAQALVEVGESGDRELREVIQAAPARFEKNNETERARLKEKK